MERLLIVVAFFLVASCSTPVTNVGDAESNGQMTKSQELPRGNPEAVRMSSDGLNKIDELVQQYIEDDRIPGAVIGVMRRDKVVYLKAHGMLEDNEPMPEDAIFIMASSAKPVIGVATLILVDDGLISPMDPVSKYIPEYAELQVAVPLKPASSQKMSKTKPNSNNKSKNKGNIPAYRLEPVNRPLTIHDLLTHTAGVGTRGGLASIIAKDRAKPSDTLATWVPRMAARPLDFQPGTRSAYSPNDGLKVVERIIEIVSGMPLHKFIQSRILDPLDMKDTHFDVPSDKLYQMPSRYRSKAKGDGKVLGEEDLSAYVSGAGGLFSTTRDYLRFQQMLLNGGTLFGHQILKPETVAMMTTNQVGDLHTKAAKGGPGLGKGYTSGITLEQNIARGGRITGSYGWGGAAGTVSWNTPSEKLVVVYMGNPRSGGLPGKLTPIIQDAIIDNN
jgi:CubicO group peptidase (beta-lactamase class C family)